MSTNTSTPIDYGEPWRYCIEGHPFVVNSRDAIVIGRTDEAMGDMDIHRAIACVNALAGIPDPAAAIQAARDALNAAQHGPNCDWWRAENVPPGPCDCGLEAALNLLTPKP